MHNSAEATSYEMLYKILNLLAYFGSG